MPLLSKEERQTLTPDEKRALRKERRAVRREERGPILGIKWEKLEPLAETLILEIAGDLLPGEEKMQEVIDELAERADEFLEWKGQKVYEKLKAEGKLDSEDGEE